MADFLRIYRRFYRVDVGPDLSTAYSLVDPVSLVATANNYSLSAVVEASASTVNASVGVYYADLSSSLYSSNYEYEVDWQVVYAAGAPTKHLYSRFRFPDSVTGSTGAIIIREVDVELLTQVPLEIEVERHTLTYEIITT